MKSDDKITDATASEAPPTMPAAPRPGAIDAASSIDEPVVATAEAAPRLVVCRFNGRSKSSDIARLARVLASTAARHCAGWSFELQDIGRRSMTPVGLRPSHADNLHKLEAWARAIDASADGDRVLLMDADTAILRPLDPIWSKPFDLAYTVRPRRSEMPFNSGVVAVRVNAKTRAFMSEWVAENRAMAADQSYHAKHRQRFGGINQAAFGVLIDRRKGEKDDKKIRLATVPCLEWNCEDTSWPAFDPAVTRILHVKGALRAHLFNLTSAEASSDVQALAALWRQLEATA